MPPTKAAKAVGHIKRAVCSGMEVPFESGLAIERELAADLIDLYMSSLSNRMNQVMKVLTVIATIFIPLMSQ